MIVVNSGSQWLSRDQCCEAMALRIAIRSVQIADASIRVADGLVQIADESVQLANVPIQVENRSVPVKMCCPRCENGWVQNAQVESVD